MMPSGQEVAAGVHGAWRLLLFDTGGMSSFEDSVEGFWKSFYAAVLTAPGYVIVVGLSLAEVEPAVGFLHLLVIESCAYVIQWTAFPLAAFYVTDMIGRSESYIRFIVALNWSRVIQLVIYLPVVLLVAAEAFTPQFGALLTLAAALAVLLYQWFLTRTALATTGPAAGMLVALDLAISLVTTWFTDGMVT